MKKSLLVLSFVVFLLIGPSSAFAGRYLTTLSWDTNIFMGYNAGEALYADSLRFDVGVGSDYYTFNGIITLNHNTRAFACTGTGYLSLLGMIEVGLTCGTSTVMLTLNNQTLNGTISVIRDEVEIDSGLVYLRY